MPGLDITVFVRGYLLKMDPNSKNYCKEKVVWNLVVVMWLKS